VLSGTTLSISAGTEIKINSAAESIFRIDSAAAVVNDGVIVLGENVTVSEHSGYPISGDGYEITTKDFLQSLSDSNIAGLGLVLTTDIPAGTTTIKRGHTSLYPEINAINRWFELQTTQGDASIHLLYDSTELNSNNVSLLKILNSNDGSSNWINLGGVSTTNFSVSAPIFNNNGYFTLAPLNLELLTINKDTFCAGELLELEFKVTGVLNASNNFILELSDPSGDYSTALTLDTIQGLIPEKFSAYIPDTLNSSDSYRIRIRTTSAGENFDLAGLVIGKKPEVSLTAAVSTVCENGENIELQINPPGGTLSGPALDNNLFNPLIAGAGTHEIEYYFEQDYGCSSTAILSLEVYPLPIVDFILPEDSVCLSSQAISLEALPTGGEFSGDGITGNYFEPELSGSGEHIITYTYTDSNSCSDFKSSAVFVRELPEVILAGLNSFYCENDPVVALNKFPADAVISGSGIIDDYFFSPAIAGTGIHAVYIEYTDNNGCQNSAEYNSEIFPNPIATLASDEIRVCSSVQEVQLNGSPLGGEFSGTALIENIFSPSIAGPGIFELSYTYINSEGCADSAKIEIEVLENPAVSLNLSNSFCENDAAVIPNFSPSGGILSGNGIINESTFSPQMAGTGNHLISYYFQNSDGCSNSAQQNVFVASKPIVSVAAEENSLCSSALPTNINALPAGGILWGNGIINSQFDPSAVPPGNHIVSYSYTDSDGCSDTAYTEIEVKEDPIVTLSVSDLFCENDAAVLPNFSPSGGILSGNGIINESTFNPQLAGPGNHLISYHFQNSDGCSNSAQQNVFVAPKPIVSVAAEENSLCSSALPTNINALPAGGILWGNGIMNFQFDPSAVPPGNHIVSYSYTDSDGCSDTAYTEIEVKEIPVVTLSISDLFCENDAAVLPNFSPSGGILSGNGITSDFTFNPQLAGPGQHTISYYYEDSNGCNNLAENTIIVYPKPLIVFELEEDSVCFSSLPMNLQASPAGGTYFGIGIFNNEFIPAEAGPGSHSLSYYYADINGCRDTVLNDIFVRTNPEVFIQAINSLCENDNPVQLQASPVGGTFSGHGIEYNEFFNPTVSKAGIHQLTYYFEDSFGCFATAEQTVKVYEQPVIPEIIQNGNTLTTDAEGNFQWYLNGVPVTNGTEKFYSATTSGFYSVKTTNFYGCSAESELYDFTFSTEHIPGFILVYPNPSQEKFFIKFDKNYDYIELSIYNIDSRLLMKNNLSNIIAGQVTEIDISTLANGKYILLIKTEIDIIRRTILKMN
jgi:hypothetical protein